MPNKFAEKLLDALDIKKYSWDDFEKIKKGYKAIMEFESIDLTDMEIYK